MDKLSKSQKDEHATSFAILALYDGGAEITSEQITTLLEATGNTSVEPFYPIIFANYLSDPENVAKLVACPATGGGGGGGT
jgi:ribosomal protein L12E/L44/L45/RPP1/RPP2